jgi:hypothetical protein
MEIPERIKQIDLLIAEDPEDPFLYYARCLELTKISPAEGNKNWEDLLLQFPEYLPSYYHAGLSFKETGEKEKALEIWKKGILLAERTSDRHALTELRGIYQNTLLDEED